MNPGEHLPKTEISRHLGASLADAIVDYRFPDVFRVRQCREQPSIGDASAAVASQICRPEIRSTIRPGDRLCIAVGSRGITGISQIVSSLVKQLRAAGADPFIIPAMGSHGGATALGQADVLARLGVTEEICNAPVIASMDTVEIGTLDDGLPVYYSADAASADAVIPVARVKSHTAFRGPLESGLFKMMAVGLGKSRGAETLHGRGMHRFAKLIPAVGQVVLTTQPVIFGLAIVENGLGQLAALEAILPNSMETREKELLAYSKALTIGLPFERLDVLVLGEIGKDISGSGMDPHVTGRFTRSSGFASRPHVQVIAALKLSAATRGNAVGIGLADVTTACLADQIDWAATYTNAITASNVTSAMLPLVMENDRACMAVSAILARVASAEDLRMVIAPSTLEMTELWVTRALLPDLAKISSIECSQQASSLTFDDHGRLILDWKPTANFRQLEPIEFS